MKYPGQLKNTYFRKLWFSDILVGSADNMEMIVISWVIISKTNSGLLLGLYGAIRFFSTVFHHYLAVSLIVSIKKQPSLYLDLIC